MTDGLVKEFPNRIIDFPPDETTLLGAAMGYSQVGLTPIVEIPYAKYLDCGVDTFYELAISNWLTNGQRPNGMIVRIQGFDRGVFGGNFHTHNMLSHIPPGVDAVCYSNGRDYARGFRNAIKQAQAGRVVMFIDCTNLLNLRHKRHWFFVPLLSIMLALRKKTASTSTRRASPWYARARPETSVTTPCTEDLLQTAVMNRSLSAAPSRARRGISTSLPMTLLLLVCHFLIRKMVRYPLETPLSGRPYRIATFTTTIT